MKKYLESAQRVNSQGLSEDTCLVLDLSPSMEADDYKPSRLQGAIHAASALLDVKRDRFPLDRVAVIGFSKTAEVLHPLVEVGDGFDSLCWSLERLETGPYTNIGAGLQKAGKLLSAGVSDPIGKLAAWASAFFTQEEKQGSGNAEPNRKPRCVLLSDGDHNRGPEPVPVARQLKDAGIVIDVIGIGSRSDVDSFNESQLMQVASQNPDGTARYYFIEDTEDLIRTFQTLAGHIRPLGDLAARGPS